MPWNVLTLFSFIRPRTPPVSVFTTLSLRCKHLAEIEPDVVETDAVLGGFLFREGEMIARREERLARDATDVQAGAAEFLVFLDDRGLQPELRGANRRDITAGAGADDDKVK